MYTPLLEGVNHSLWGDEASVHMYRRGEGPRSDFNSMLSPRPDRSFLARELGALHGRTLIVKLILKTPKE